MLENSNDGFFIASEDLKLRGPGDFFGIRQSGDALFELADIYNHADMLQLAQDMLKKYGKTIQPVRRNRGESLRPCYRKNARFPMKTVAEKGKKAYNRHVFN